jgi:hypothetical protein
MYGALDFINRHNFAAGCSFDGMGHPAASVKCTGCPVPSAAQASVVVVRTLSTNAAKYGQIDGKYSKYPGDDTWDQTIRGIRKETAAEFLWSIHRNETTGPVNQLAPFFRGLDVAARFFLMQLQNRARVLPAFFLRSYSRQQDHSAASLQIAQHLDPDVEITIVADP